MIPAINVALGKKTEQFGRQGTWPSLNAVDRVKECQNINSTYLTLSGFSDLPWWKVDLGGLFQIHQVNVFGRNDSQYNQLLGFRLYLSRDENFTDSNIVYTNTAQDYNHGQIVITSNLSGLFRFIELDLPGPYVQAGRQIVLCEVEILVKMSNIATDKQATMSTHYNDMTADKCIDGNPRRNPDSCHCCSHSNNEANPWITVDLLQVHEIFQIHVAGRKDRFEKSRDVSGLEIFGNGTNNRILGNFTSANGTDVIVTLPQGIHSRYITLRRPIPQNFNEWYLVVCEVEIYIKYCKPGTYGKLCEQQCGHCSHGSCKIDSGHCPNGECMAGWTGVKCETECDLGHYGINCSSVCSSHCLNNITQCNKTTGICMQGCEAGYMGHNCSMECITGKFGRDCGRTCTNNCLQGFDKCSKVSGECQNGCLSGFKGHNCSTPCERGRFGENCTLYCSIHCFKGIEQCDKSSGICKEGCDAGYMGNNCSTVCPDGQYGRNCTDTCSDYCKNDKAACNKSTGYCMGGCDPGYTGPKCSSVCPSGTFGINCSRKCHCRDETDCRQTDGHCSTGCAFGWSGFNCSNDLNIIERIREMVSTSQSSTFSPDSNPQDFNSSKAIDGIPNYAIDTCKCCSVTNGAAPPSWWQIDLKQKYLLGGLQIFGRGSDQNKQLEHAIVYAGNYSTTVNPSENMTNVYEVPELTNKRHFTKELEEPLIAQFILVELAQTVMTLCELKLYKKECDIGNFGTGCTHKCHCKDKRACNQVTGKCQTPGCLAGWQGEACENVCDVRKFGDRCNNTCNCINGTLCDNTNGTCFVEQCDPGWLLPNCSERMYHFHDLYNVDIELHCPA
ncbi:protein draper-like [Ruditapes philippinarum]|uniref:protein draper-like n=1 Tax=Ruditapes philippinarum TaxID=129788 RepID=UPI00295B2AA7|nr:protein draper-like [Ruditapes philippinarum]